MQNYVAILAKISSLLPLLLAVLGSLTTLFTALAVLVQGAVKIFALEGTWLDHFGHALASIALDIPKLIASLKKLLGFVGAQAGRTNVRFLLVFLLTWVLGCATLKAFWTDTIDCEKQDAPSLLAAVPQIIQALASQNYVAAVQDLASQQGEVIQCATAMLAQQQSSAKTIVAVVDVQAPVAAKAADCVKSWSKQVVNVPTLLPARAP